MGKKQRSRTYSQTFSSNLTLYQHPRGELQTWGRMAARAGQLDRCLADLVLYREAVTALSTMTSRSAGNIPRAPSPCNDQSGLRWSEPLRGAYAEFVCLPQPKLVPVPSGLGAAEAVSLVLNYVTAHQMLHRSAKVKPGQRVLIHGAAGRPEGSTADGSGSPHGVAKGEVGIAERKPTPGFKD